MNGVAISMLFIRAAAVFGQIMAAWPKLILRPSSTSTAAAAEVTVPLC